MYDNRFHHMYEDNRGNGYDHDAGMSVNAVMAYERGVKPISKITVADLKEAGWTKSKKLAVSLAKQGVWHSHEWHHSGGEWFNKVDFYDPSHLIAAWDRLSEDRKTSLLKPQKTEAEEGIKVAGSYTIWGGSRRRPRKIGHQKFTGILKENGWIYLDNGGRKKASGRHIGWKEV